MPALHGVGVLVTRPEHQAMPLCRLLELQGASTLRLPALEIKAHIEGAADVGRTQREDFRQQLLQLGLVDLAGSVGIHQ